MRTRKNIDLEPWFCEFHENDIEQYKTTCGQGARKSAVKIALSRVPLAFTVSSNLSALDGDLGEIREGEGGEGGFGGVRGGWDDCKGMESIAGYLKWTIFGSRKSTCSKDVDTNAAAWCACWSLGGSHFDCPRCTRSKTQQMEHAHKPTVENVCTRVLKRHVP